MGPTHMLNLHVLATGSRGNSSLIVDTETNKGIVIDCGICKRDFFERCKQADFDLHNLSAILITHEHSDHVKGLGVVLRGLAKEGIRPEVYVNDSCVRASNTLQCALEGRSYHSFSETSDVDIDALRVFPFPTSHDAAASFGFRIEGSHDALGFITDSGIVMDQAHDYLQNVRLLALESNHDLKMLEEGPYPYSTKKRIASKLGHLSNFQAADELESLLSNRLERIVAMHVSETNNTYDLPPATLTEAVKRNDHPAQVLVGYQRSMTSL